MLISMCGASRGRPEALQKTLEGALERALIPSKVEVLLRLDNDDPSVEDYLRQRSQLWEGAPVAIHVGPRLGMGAARPIQAMVDKAQGRIVMQLSDDQDFILKGWDEMLREAEEERKGPAVYKVWEGRTQLENPIVNRRYLDVVGYLYPKELEHLYSDTFVETLAVQAGILVELPHLQILHNKHVRQDATHKEARTNAALDFKKFIGMRHHMATLVENLQNASH